MKEFTWKIVEVDAGQGAMLVEYTHEGARTTLNLPMPPFGENLGVWVKAYAPVADWDRAETAFADVQPGMHGDDVIDDVDPAEPLSDNANVIGSWNEEYLRAIVYSVLEEMREASV